MAAQRPFSQGRRGCTWTLALLLAATAAQAQAPTSVSAPGSVALPEAAAPPAQPQGGAQRVGAMTGVSAFAGLRVAEIRLEGALARNGERLRPRILQTVGRPLDRNQVRRSIQSLYATGEFSNLRVEGERTSEGEVVLVFIAEANYFVGAVQVDGIPGHGPTESQLEYATKLDLGELFLPESLTAAVAGIERALRDRGFFQARVTSDQERHPDTQQIDLRFHISAGPRARVGQVTFQGESGFSPVELAAIADLRAGDPVTSGKAQRALERLRKRYNRNGHLVAEIALAKAEYRAATNTVDYAFDVRQGPVVEISVKGEKVSPGALKKYVPVYEENALDEDLLEEGRRNLRDYFQSQGYFDVRVAFRREPSAAGREGVEYQVDEGERHKLHEVAIDGNKYFSDALVRERMLVQPAGWLLSHGRFSQSMLTRDVRAIEDLYHANGFLAVKVSGQAQDDYGGEKGKMRVAIHIEEGPQTLVQALHLVGNHAVPESELREILTTSEGQPFSDFNLATDREQVLNYYYNHGRPQVGFQVDAHPSPENPLRMDVSYTLQEGDPVTIDRVLVSGLHYTRPYVVAREIQVHPGAPFSQADMLETQRRLYDLGIFNGVDIAVQDPEGDSSRKNVLLQLTEAKRWTFDYGFGLEIQTGSDPGKSTPQGRTGISPRVEFDATRINFLGRDHTLVFKARYGRLQQRALFSYEAPRILGREDLKATFTIFYDDTADVRTFTAQRLESSAQIEQKVSKVTTLLYRLAYRRVKVDPRTLVISPQLVPLFSQPVRIGMPSFTYIRDQRDDALDAHKGSYTAADVGVAPAFLGSQATFSRFLLQNSTYYSFRKSTWVFARSTKIGIEEPFGRHRIIPLPELFVAGGANSQRGFAINQAGPRDQDTGFPIGGQAMFINNLELRTPPIPLPLVDDNVSLVFFHDVGNVFATPSDMWSGLFRSSQPQRSQCTLLTVTARCNFNYMAHAVGGGIRYKTPIGPVRVDFGYNLNPPTFPIRSEARSETLTHFNVFFSIGQTF